MWYVYVMEYYSAIVYMYMWYKYAMEYFQYWKKK